MQYLQKSNLWENNFFDFFIVFHIEIILFLSRLNDQMPLMWKKYSYIRHV